MKKLSIFLLIFIYSISIGTKTIHANEILFQETFDSNLNSWEIQRGNLSDWQIVEGRLEATVNSTYEITEITPKANFWSNTNNDDLKITFDYMPIYGEDKNISFGFQDLKNWYEVHFTGGIYEFVQLRDGKVVFSHSDNLVMTNHKNYQIEIIIREKNIVFYINSELVFDLANDSFNKAGKLSLKAGTGAAAPTKVVFDNILVTTIDNPLNVPPFKQNDPEWGSHIYDTADQWSETPTIARYGCATTSMAMILNAHGINKISDDITLNPDTLNNWLNEQEDGYVGEGLINWYAVTRLTNDLNKKYGTYKLEYSKITEDALHAATQEIEAKRPVILQIDGHFLVANEVLKDSSDLGILDPYYTYSKFSEHKTELLSTRQFTPSNTDLSNIVIYHDPNLNVTISDSEGNVVSTSTTTEYIIPKGENAKTTKQLDETTVQKPNTDEYTISVSQETFGPYSYEIFSYTTEGDVSIATASGFVGANQENSSLLFSKNDLSTLGQTITWSTFLEDLELMSNEKKVVNAVKKGRQTIASQHLGNNTHTERLLISYYRKFVSKNESLFSEIEKAYLENTLDTLESQLAQ